MRIDLSFLPALAAAFMLMFARIGTMVMLMPALGERAIPPRIRLVIALALTLVCFRCIGRPMRSTAARFGPFSSCSARNC